MDIVEQARRRIPAGSFFRHYKGNTYRVLNVAIAEADGKPLVVYESHLGEIYARPVTEWEELLDTNGRFINRFQKLPRESEPSHWIPAQLAFDLQKKAKDFVKPISMSAAAKIIGVDMDELMRLFRQENPLVYDTVNAATVQPGEYHGMYALSNQVPARLDMVALDLVDGVEDGSPLQQARKEFPHTRIGEITTVGMLRSLNLRFAEWVDKNPTLTQSWLTGEQLGGPYVYDRYVQQRYPSEFAWLHKMSKECGFENPRAFRIYDDTDAGDRTMFHAMRCCSSSEARAKFYSHIMVETEEERIARGGQRPLCRVMEFTYDNTPPLIERLPQGFKFTDLGDY